MLISRSIANLFNGVSQQSPSIRQASQAEIQENAYSSIVDGLHKRPPTTHIAKLSSTAATNAYCHVINRDATEKYVVFIKNQSIQVWDINGVSKSVATPNGVGYLDVPNPQEDLAIVTIADYTLIVNKKMGVARGDYGTTYGSTVEKSKYSDLPATGTAGVLYKISGTPDNAWTVYYCYWNGSAYVECPESAVGNRLTSSTMPHRLVRESNGTFTFSPITWADRPVGDDKNSKPPSFVGATITDLFFFRNRLGFLSGENVIFSRAGDYFNFWRETCTQVLDSDPVDVSISHIKVSNLKHAIPFNKNLLLFSEQTQFMIQSSDTLTPKTVAINQTTEFECSSRVKPVASGSNVYFAVEKSGYSAIREYYVMPYQNSFEADDVTAHVPKYIPGGVTKLVASTNDDFVVALSEQDRSSVYIYKYYWKGEEKLQSAWSKWTFPGSATILSMDVMATKLFMVINRSDGVYLEAIDLQVGLVETNVPMLVNLDRKFYATGTYNSGTNLTSWALPYQATDAQVISVASSDPNKGAKLVTQNPSNTTVQAYGDYSGKLMAIGIPYTMKYRFSPQFARDDKGAIGGASFKLRGMKLFYTKSGYFRVEVTPQARETYTYPFTGKTIGGSAMVIGSAQLDTGIFKVPVVSDGETAVIELINDTYLPSYFQSAELEAFMVNRARRV
jgi:hypothetical protein